MSETGKKPWYKKIAFSVQQVFSSSPAEVEEKVTMREAAGTTVDDDDANWRPLTGDTKRDLSPITAKRMRDMSLYLWESNNLAKAIIELPIAYILGEGVSLTCTDEDSQKVLNKFWDHPINKMDIKLTKKVRELSLFGEQCYPAFVNELNGAVQLGYLDPELIDRVFMDPANKEQPIGVFTQKDLQGNQKKFRVIINGPESLFTDKTQKIRATFKDGDCFYFSINDISNGSRGRSDLLAQADWLDAYEQFMFSELDRNTELRSFLWDVKLTGATPDEVKKRAKEITPPGPNSVRVHNDAEEWEAVTPGLNASDTTPVGRMFRNHILGGANIPEHWFGGGGDVNRAVGAEMHEPTFKILSMRQRFIKYMLEEMGRYVLRKNILANDNVEPEFDDPRIKAEAVFPEMSSKDISKYAAALQQVVVGCALAIDKKLMTEETAINVISSIAGRLGIEIDAKAELAAVNILIDKQKDDEKFTTPSADDIAADKLAA
jgi:hypothetical protein